MVEKFQMTGSAMGKKITEELDSLLHSGNQGTDIGGCYKNW